jgi:hypothetical protein
MPGGFISRRSLQPDIQTKRVDEKDRILERVNVGVHTTFETLWVFSYKSSRRWIVVSGAVIPCRRLVTREVFSTRFWSVPKHQARFLVFLNKPLDDGESRPQKTLDFSTGTVGCPKPDELWWMAIEDASLLKVRVFGDNREAMVFRILPNGTVVRAPKSAMVDVR